MKSFLELAELPQAADHPTPTPHPGPWHRPLASAHPQAPASEGPRLPPLEAEAGEMLPH